MHVESQDWHFNVENHEKGVTIDVAIKLLITKKKK
jgi:sulfate adenylyltransferase subunit 1 (EFTu-like GTPase family)